MIIIDQVVTHGTGGTGNDTVPTGVTGLDWCHITSDTSLLELTTFLTLNILTIGCLATNVRTPLLGSNMTYAGLVSAQRTAAITAGASPQRASYVVDHTFDTPGPGSTYEP